MKQKLYEIYNLLNKKYYTISFIIGTVIMFLALFTVTILPVLIKMLYKPLDSNIYVMVEFILLFISSVLYVFSYRHYKNQVFMVCYAIILYYIFVKLYMLFI